MQFTKDSFSFKPKNSFILGFTSEALCKNPLKYVPSPKALVISSILDAAREAFTGDSDLTIISAGALKNSLSSPFGSSKKSLYILIHIWQYLFIFSGVVSLFNKFSPRDFKVSRTIFLSSWSLSFTTT